jgi:hypothetical protein
MFPDLKNIEIRIPQMVNSPNEIKDIELCVQYLESYFSLAHWVLSDNLSLKSIQLIKDIFRIQTLEGKK